MTAIAGRPGHAVDEAAGERSTQPRPVGAAARARSEIIQQPAGLLRRGARPTWQSTRMECALGGVSHEGELDGCSGRARRVRRPAGQDHRRGADDPLRVARAASSEVLADRTLDPRQAGGRAVGGRVIRRLSTDLRHPRPRPSRSPSASRPPPCVVTSTFTSPATSIAARMCCRYIPGMKSGMRLNPFCLGSFGRGAGAGRGRGWMVKGRSVP
jgi:hypothetical protein